MKSSAVMLLSLLACGCASWTPAEHADSVAALPGRAPLRVGVVVLGTERVLPEALPELPAAPGGAGPRMPIGELYAERMLLPESIDGDAVVDALQRLGAFTDVVLLPFDGRGLSSREAVVQRVQDRVWPTAIEQELDALLVIEGVRDDGLRWSDGEEGLLTLDTVLWWLAWPFGLWIHDRSYTPDCGLVAAMFWLGDSSSSPVAEVVTAGVEPRSLSPWDRAATPLLGLVVPPAWLADDPQAVAAEVHDWSRAMLPIELVRQIKLAGLGARAAAGVDLRIVGGVYVLKAHSGQEITEATLVGLPRGALTDTAGAAAVPVPLAGEIELTPTGPRHWARGVVDRADVDRAGSALVRAVVTLASGERVSRTWPVADLAR